MEIGLEDQLKSQDGGGGGGILLHKDAPWMQPNENIESPSRPGRHEVGRGTVFVSSSQGAEVSD